MTMPPSAATSRWAAVAPAFLKLPEGQVVVVHVLIRGEQFVGRVSMPAEITSQARAIQSLGIQTLRFYRFDAGLWEMAWKLLQAIDESTKNAPKLFEEELLKRLLSEGVVRDDLITPVPDDMEEFFLHRVGTEQAIVMASAEEDIFNVPENPLGRLIAPKGTVAMYWPAIEKERDDVRKAREQDPILGTPFVVIHHHSSQEETDERTRSRFRRNRVTTETEPVPGMGASESKDRGEPSYVPAGLARTRRGQAGQDLG